MVKIIVGELNNDDAKGDIMMAAAKFLEVLAERKFSIYEFEIEFAQPEKKAKVSK